MANDEDALAPEILSAKLLGRALHDIAGPMSGLTAALDLMGEAEEESLRGEALVLARDGLAKMSMRIAFNRAAFAGGLNGESIAVLLRTPYIGSRARLEVGTLDPRAPLVINQGALILSQISAEALATGGGAWVGVDCHERTWRARIEGEGARAHIPPETLAGLEGRPLEGGLTARWAPARYLHALTTSARAALTYGAGEGAFWFEVTSPA